MAEALIKDDNDGIHSYNIKDDKGRALTDHSGIWLLELSKCNNQLIESEQQRWLRFFNEGEQLNDDRGVPDWMTIEEMRQAMSTLRQFSDKEQNYLAYQARQEYLREQLTLQHALDEARKAKLAAQKRERAALVRERAALDEIERLNVLLAKNQLN